MCKIQENLNFQKGAEQPHLVPWGCKTAHSVPAPRDESPIVSAFSLDRNPHSAMYESFYNLQHAPFPASPDPAALVIYGDLGTQLGVLAGCLTSGQGIAVMTGPA